MRSSIGRNIEGWLGRAGAESGSYASVSMEVPRLGDESNPRLRGWLNCRTEEGNAGDS